MDATSPIPPLKTGQLPQILARLSDVSGKAGWTEVKGNTGILELGVIWKTYYIAWGKSLSPDWSS